MRPWEGNWQHGGVMGKIDLFVGRVGRAGNRATKIGREKTHAHFCGLQLARITKKNLWSEGGNALVAACNHLAMNKLLTSADWS